ncbi:DoxX family protein [Dictyobacter kobayashii]|uniref:DoxX family protein n=1 Tax=Dictyobacter kobayashii TaxID=2014872 RepID=A0A402AYE3_9CHLR|nr:hypothetical protein [Dictyobacter kobayashii]GCE24108.1 hypothetical protein KDK_79080 [Dictyobacter kobayashii]
MLSVATNYDDRLLLETGTLESRLYIMKNTGIAAAKLKKPARITLGIVFMFASIFHFTATDVEIQLVPPFLPWRRAAIYITGVFELLGGIGVLIPRFQVVAGRGLAALLVAIFPANIYHTFARKRFQGPTRSPIYHILRWPMQGLLVWWALWCSGKDK